MKLNLHHSAPLEMLFPMASFFPEFGSFRFWPKTMDYSKAFSSNSLRTPNSSLEGAMKLKFASFCSCSFQTPKASLVWLNGKCFNNKQIFHCMCTCTCIDTKYSLCCLHLPPLPSPPPLPPLPSPPPLPPLPPSPLPPSQPGREFKGKDLALLAIPQFCFPDIDQWKPTRSYRSEKFSFVLTDIEGNRRFGYCRRLLVSDGDVIMMSL